MQSTLNIFKIFYKQLPPMVPGHVMNEMKKTIERLETQSDVIVEEVERLMIKFGYQVWPWHQAHKEFLLATEEKMGDHFLTPKLSSGLQEKYQGYRNYGMGIGDLHSGRPMAEYFTAEERLELAEALVDTRKDLNNYVCHQAGSMEKDKFLQRVEVLSEQLNDIKNHLNTLKKMAEAEGEHENLANEIRSKVRGFEFGLCWLGPDIDHEEVKQSIEFFRGRRLDLNRMKGIHLPVEVDFYAEA